MTYPLNWLVFLGVVNFVFSDVRVWYGMCVGVTGCKRACDLLESPNMGPLGHFLVRLSWF